MKLYKNSIAILGILPPPIGGVSIHNMRLIDSLQDNGSDFDFLSLRKYKNGKLNKIQYIKTIFLYAIFCRNEVIHYNLGSYCEGIIVLAIAKVHRAKLVFTIHGERPSVKYKILKKICKLICDKHVDVYIAVNKNILKKAKIDGKKEIKLLSAYLPPTAEEKTVDLECKYKNFVKRYKYIIIGNAFKLVFMDKDIDLYGVDMCIRLIRDLKTEGYDVGMIFCIPEVGNDDYYQKLKDDIDCYGIIDRFLITNEYLPLIPFLRKADLFVRPTSTDGAPLSIEEAISLNVPVLASDVCERPVNVETFGNRDYTDFFKKTKQIIDNIDIYKNKMSVIQEKSVVEEYLKIYKSLMN